MSRTLVRALCHASEVQESLSITEVFNNAKSEQPAENKIVVVISSDKGLCGGIHSSVTKATRKIFAAAPDAPLKTELAPETPHLHHWRQVKGAALARAPQEPPHDL